jgi:hypothetical protein
MNQLRKITSLEEVQLLPLAIEKAVAAFVYDSHTAETGASPEGLYHQTLENIAACTVFRQDGSRHLWMADHEGEVVAYALCHISKDVDNKLCYWMTQAWVHPIMRGKKEVKGWFQKLRTEAKKNLCSHILIPSSRGTAAYCRFLGRGWKPYVSILKEDI